MRDGELGFCGVDCAKCSVYIATKTNNYEARKEVADMLFEKYNVRHDPDAINCTGCVEATIKNTSIMGHCRECVLRKCAAQKKLLTCAECSEYVCEKLSTKWNEIPNGTDARENLYAIKNFSVK